MTEPSDAIRRAQRRYWRKNITLMSALLSIWAFVGLGCGILWADALNDAARIGGVPLGFWFAQQGGVITFVILILIYAIMMNALDNAYHREVGPKPDGAKPEPTNAEGEDA